MIQSSTGVADPRGHETGFVAGQAEQQIPPLRYPGFPVEMGGVGELHAAFSYRKPHTWLLVSAA
jgi:hypothetical protein